MLARLAVLMLAGLVAAACAERDPDPVVPELKQSARMVERTAPSMGTELRVHLWTSDQLAADAAFEAIIVEFERLEGLMSHWRESSDLQRINAAAGKNAVLVDAEILGLLRTARQVSEWTDGKFDVTFGVMSGLWKFDEQNKDSSIPDPNEVARRRKLINFRDVEINETSGTVRLRRAGMAVNLGGIGKGYAVDRAGEILRARGFNDFMIQFGGDMFVAGKAGDRPWRLGIQDPRGSINSIFASMELSDSSFSTSGDYERYFIKDGRRYHHILDPATGEPARGARSVTILTTNATVADGLSTGVFILGPEAGMALIERLPDVEGVIVGADNQVRVSSGLRGGLRDGLTESGRFTLRTPPTDAP